MRRFPVSLFSLACTLSAALCQDLPEPDKEPSGEGVEKTTQSVEELARLARRSAVGIRHGGRTGGEGGTGSGFVISEQGLIATCAHVIGESRPLTVHFDDGSEHKVTSIHAWDAKLDLAVLQIDSGDKTLIPIRLAEANSIIQGAEVVAMGAPHGLEFSVVRGVLSALRDFDGRTLLQVAMLVRQPLLAVLTAPILLWAERPSQQKSLFH